MVQHDNFNILGLKFYYYKYGTKKEKVKGESTLKFKPLQTMFTSLRKEKLKISDDDYIKEIFGFADNEIK